MSLLAPKRGTKSSSKSERTLFLQHVQKIYPDLSTTIPPIDPELEIPDEGLAAASIRYTPHDKQTQSAFFRLPTEIRLSIYRYAGFRDSTVHIALTRTGPLQSWSITLRRPLRRWRWHVSTCRRPSHARQVPGNHFSRMDMKGHGPGCHCQMHDRCRYLRSPNLNISAWLRSCRLAWLDVYDSFFETCTFSFVSIPAIRYARLYIPGTILAKIRTLELILDLKFKRFDDIDLESEARQYGRTNAYGRALADDEVSEVSATSYEGSNEADRDGSERDSTYRSSIYDEDRSVASHDDSVSQDDGHDSSRGDNAEASDGAGDDAAARRDTGSPSHSDAQSSDSRREDEAIGIHHIKVSADAGATNEVEDIEQGVPGCRETYGMDALHDICFGIPDAFASLTSLNVFCQQDLQDDALFRDQFVEMVTRTADEWMEIASRYVHIKNEPRFLPPLSGSIGTMFTRLDTIPDPPQSTYKRWHEVHSYPTRALWVPDWLIQIMLVEQLVARRSWEVIQIMAKRFFDGDHTVNPMDMIVAIDPVFDIRNAQATCEGTEDDMRDFAYAAVETREMYLGYIWDHE
ncbi:Hypothetical protein D9617_4g000450 [Elsinoe fawcettii]|nr:Hypothetical protein D9617_4g000450 [Elsinoe fawcettii]